MPETRPNPLRDAGKPLFFRADNPAEVGLAAPPARLGESIRLIVRSLGGMQKEALAVSSRTGAVWRLASDEGDYLAGLDEAPCPLSFLSAGMVGAHMTELLALAAARGIALDGVRLIQDNYYTMTGSALKGTMTGGARDVDVTAQIASDADDGTLTELVRDAAAASPLGGLMRGVHESLFTLTHNGREIDTGRSRPLLSDAARAAAPDPSGRFDAARPADGDWSALIRRGGKTPKAEHTVTLANDSLSDEQHRVLHLRVICTLRDDGVKEIEQQLFNPHGSIFRFLSDEAPRHGGRGLAPDAASLISAGIGLCFMTQLGRYAKIARKDLRGYRIVQDAHFSVGGGAGPLGRADPIETHVYLETGENDDFARTALAMAEQTCFLHAFCRTDLKTNVAVQPYDAGPPPVVAAAP